MKIVNRTGRARRFVKGLTASVTVLDGVILVNHDFLVEAEVSWRVRQDLRHGETTLQWIWGQTKGIERDPQSCLSFQRSLLLMLQHDFVVFVQMRKE